MTCPRCQHRMAMPWKAYALVPTAFDRNIECQACGARLRASTEIVRTWWGFAGIFFAAGGFLGFVFGLPVFVSVLLAGAGAATGAVVAQAGLRRIDATLQLAPGEEPLALPPARATRPRDRKS